jgi:hypothetical protein
MKRDDEDADDEPVEVLRLVVDVLIDEAARVVVVVVVVVVGTILHRLRFLFQSLGHRRAIPRASDVK